MLIRFAQRRTVAVARRAQNGMVMMVALVILIVMTIGGLALIRSMDTANVIAGNMAFQQSATHSSDAGVEIAIRWLETNNAVAGVLNNSVPGAGYTASTPAIAANQTGEAFWNAMSAAGVCTLDMSTRSCAAPPGFADNSGNTLAYMIQRLCNGTGATLGNGCAVSPGSGVPLGNNEDGGDIITPPNSAVYYRITVRVSGPRNTLSFVQAVVSM